jgi:PhnO protein
MNEIEITFAIKEDFNEVKQLFHQLWPEVQLDEGRIKNIFEDDLSTNSRMYIVAKMNGKFVGLCTLFFRNDLRYGKVALIDELVVDENSRGNGIGTKLLEKATEIARSSNCYRLELHSNIKRIEAHKFYEANGFEKSSYYFKKKL